MKKCVIPYGVKMLQIKVISLFNVSIVVLYLDIKCPYMEVVFKNKSLYGSDYPKLQTLKG